MTDLPESVAVQVAAPPKPPAQVATLSDLECALITVEVELSDGVPLLVPCKLIPQFRMIQLGNMIPGATAPVVDYKSGGIPVYNYADPAYIAAALEINFKRNCLRLAEMIQMPIPGETLQERADYIRDHFDPRVTEGLAGVISSQVEKAKARIITRAETFQ